MRALLILWFLNFLSFFGFSQVPNHISLGKEQFANTDVYGLMYSKDHRLIVATNKGVWQYDYAKEKEGFEQFKTLTKQKSNSFFDLKMDQKGTVYCKNLKNQLFRIQNNRIELYYELTPEDQCNEFYYFVDDNGDLIIFGMRIIKIDAERKVTVLYDPKRESHSWPDSRFYRVKKSNDGTISSLIVRDHTLFMISYLNGKIAEKSIESIEWFQNKKPNFRSKIHRFNIGTETIFLTNEMYFGSEGPLPNIEVKPNGIERFSQLGQTVIALHESKGLRIFSMDKDTLKSTVSLFPNTFISSVYADEQGTLFLGTFGEGVMVVPKTNSLQYSTNSLIADFDVNSENTVYLSTREGEVLKFKDGQFSKEFNFGTNADFIVTFPYSYSFSDLPFFTDFMPNLEGLSRVKDAYPVREGIYAATNSGIKFVANAPYVDKLPPFFKQVNSGVKTIFDVYGDRRFNVITYDEVREVLYFADGENLFEMKSNGRVTKLFNHGQSIRCSDALMWNGQLIVATALNGILFFQDGQVKRVVKTSENGLISNSIEKIETQNNELFIQTDQGIQIIELNSWNTKFVGFKEGLTTNLISDFAVTKDKLWIQEKHKVYAIELEDISEKEEAIHFQIDSVLIGGEKQVLGTQFELSHDERSIHFYLNYRDILRIGEAYYEYRMNEGDWERIPAKQGQLELNNLRQGSYTLDIRLHYRNELSQVKTLSFSIQPPFWMRWWFYPLILIVLVGFTVLFYRRKLKKQALHAQHMNELNNSKMTALQSQMNPHFIFNALNSIQHLVMRGNKEEAYKYITQFANLVRRTLDYSEQETIPIKDEIDLLKVYLNLEKLRFKDEFDFEFVVTELRDVRIPPMLIQPFIENALLHGLLHKEGKKRLKLIVEMKENTLHCWVEDNGVGRVEAKRIRQRQRGDHKSFALKAIDNRFRILRESYHADIGYSYEDFSPKNELDCATRVHLKIPIHS